jgi:hypothetical protein
MRAFFDLIEQDRVFLKEGELSCLPPALVSALREAGIVQDGDPGMVEVSATDLGRALRKLYGVLSREVVLPSVLDDRPVLLGWTGKEASEREVLLVAHPKVALAVALEGSHRRLVLIPTAKKLTEALRQRHGPGSFLEVEALEEALVVREGRLVRKQATASARVEDPSSTVGKHRPSLAGARRWSEIRFCMIGPALVRIDLPGRSVRCTPGDLGMLHPRSRKPTVLWEMLCAFCDGHGTLRTTRFGSAAATKKVVSRLRGRLREAFGMKAPPFRRYAEGVGWRSHFEARPDLPEDKQEGRRRMDDAVSLSDKSALKKLGVARFLR